MTSEKNPLDFTNYSMVGSIKVVNELEDTSKLKQEHEVAISKKPRNYTSAEMADEAASLTGIALELLRQAVCNPELRMSDRISCAKEILDRGHGKSVQQTVTRTPTTDILLSKVINDMRAIAKALGDEDSLSMLPLIDQPQSAKPN